MALAEYSEQRGVRHPWNLDAATWHDLEQRGDVAGSMTTFSNIATAALDQ
jgi:hypothetical protein